MEKLNIRSIIILCSTVVVFVVIFGVRNNPFEEFKSCTNEHICSLKSDHQKVLELKKISGFIPGDSSIYVKKVTENFIFECFHHYENGEINLDRSVIVCQQKGILSKFIFSTSKYSLKDFYFYSKAISQI